MSILDLVIAAWPAANDQQPMLLVLDELQAIDGWDRWLKTLIDRTEIRVVATGSSSLSEHGHVSAFARSNDPLGETESASRIYETAVYRALRSIRSEWSVREMAYARVNQAEEVDFVVVSDERTVGVEVTSGGWRQDKHAKATAAARAFGIPGLVVGGSAAPPTAQGVPWVPLRDFLLDPITSLAQAQPH